MIPPGLTERQQLAWLLKATQEKKQAESVAVEEKKRRPKREETDKSHKPRLNFMAKKKKGVFLFIFIRCIKSCLTE